MLVKFIKNIFYEEKPFEDFKIAQQKLDDRFGIDKKSEVHVPHTGMSLRARFLIAVLILSAILLTSYFIAERNYYRVESLYLVPIFVIVGIPGFFSITKTKKDSQIFLMFLVWVLSISYLYVDFIIANRWNGCIDTCGMMSIIYGAFITLYFIAGSILWVVVDTIRRYRKK